MQNFVEHGPITIAIDCNGHSLLIFEDMPLDQNPYQIETLFGYVDLSMSARGFPVPQMWQFGCLYSRQDQNQLHLKR